MQESTVEVDTSDWWWSPIFNEDKRGRRTERGTVGEDGVLGSEDEGGSVDLAATEGHRWSGRRDGGGGCT